jgi:hypothetical protein
MGVVNQHDLDSQCVARTLEKVIVGVEEVLYRGWRVVARDCSNLILWRRAGVADPVGFVRRRHAGPVVLGDAVECTGLPGLSGAQHP